MTDETSPSPVDEPSLTLHPNPFRTALLAFALIFAGAGGIALLAARSIQDSQGVEAGAGAYGFAGTMFTAAFVVFFAWLAVAAIIRSLEQGRPEYPHVTKTE